MLDSDKALLETRYIRMLADARGIEIQYLRQYNEKLLFENKSSENELSETKLHLLRANSQLDFSNEKLKAMTKELENQRQLSELYFDAIYKIPKLLRTLLIGKNWEKGSI